MVDPSSQPLDLEDRRLEGVIDDQAYVRRGRQSLAELAVKLEQAWDLIRRHRVGLMPHLTPTGKLCAIRA